MSPKDLRYLRGPNISVSLSQTGFMSISSRSPSDLRLLQRPITFSTSIKRTVPPPPFAPPLDFMAFTFVSRFFSAGPRAGKEGPDNNRSPGARRGKCQAGRYKLWCKL